MDEIYIDVGINVEDLAISISKSLSMNECLNFIIELELAYGDYGFLEMIYKHFKNEYEKETTE